MLRAVTFDFWQTLVTERRGHMRELQIDRWLARLEEHGQPRTREELEAAFAAGWQAFEDRWRENRGAWTAAHAVDLAADRLGVSLANGLRDALIDGYRVVGETADLDPAPGVDACLRLLHDAGVPLGIVCDVGLTAAPTLRARLEGFGLLGYFDAWAFSDETGWYKPAPEAFRPALEGLGVEPADAAHVGDNARTDIAGAKGLGMVAVQYIGLSGGGEFGEDHAVSPEADHVLEDLTKLPEILGLG